jgi:hypothetical protein
MLPIERRLAGFYKRREKGEGVIRRWGDEVAHDPSTQLRAGVMT